MVGDGTWFDNQHLRNKSVGQPLNNLFGDATLPWRQRKMRCGPYHCSGLEASARCTCAIVGLSTSGTQRVHAPPNLDGTSKGRRRIAIDRQRFGPLLASHRSFAARCPSKGQSKFPELIVNGE